MIELREGSAADRDAILALRRRCFAVEDPEKHDARFWDWEFGGGRMFVALDDGRLVAHLGFVPQKYVIDGEPVSAMLAVDAMTDPEYRRQQLFTRVAALAAERLRESVQISTVWQIREAVLPGFVAGGWRPLLRAPVLVKPLALRSREGVLETTTALFPDAALPPSVNHGWRDPRFLDWRFGENPCWRYSIDANDDAYVVTRRTTLRGLDTLAVADLGWRAGKLNDARALLRDAVARARAAGVHFAAVLMTLGHPALPAFVRSGFLPSPHRFRFLVNLFDDRVRLRSGKWALTWADTDHL